MTFGNGGGWSGHRYGPPLGAIVGTIVTLIAWLVFIIFYALFWSKSFDLFQNLVLTVASLMIVGLLIGLVWVVWLRRGPMRKWRDAHDQPPSENPQQK